MSHQPAIVIRDSCMFLIAHVRVNVSRDLKLFGREIIFKVFQPM